VRVRGISPDGADIYAGTGLVKSHSHSIYPDFEKIYDGPHRRDWDRLSFYCSAFNYGHRFAELKPEYFSPLRNKELRIIYLYRNPLDQMISMFRHVRGSISETHRAYVDPGSGERQVFENISEFIRNGGLEGYLKQFFTFHAMRDDTNLLMLRYEDLLRAPEEIFLRMLAFVGFEPQNARQQAGVSEAVVLAAPDHVRRLESRIGQALAFDQLDPKSSHLQSGAVGRWKDGLDQADIDLTHQRLAEFDIDPSVFTFE
jgi:hypothetical protein